MNTYLEVFGLREKLIARFAIFEGMRPGEILALRWNSVGDEVIRVVERVYKRKFNTPKNGRAREGAMSDGTLELLKEWAGLAQEPSPDGCFTDRIRSDRLAADSGDSRIGSSRFVRTPSYRNSRRVASGSLITSLPAMTRTSKT